MSDPYAYVVFWAPSLGLAVALRPGHPHKEKVNANARKASLQTSVLANVRQAYRFRLRSLVCVEGLLAITALKFFGHH